MRAHRCAYVLCTPHSTVEARFYRGLFEDLESVDLLIVRVRLPLLVVICRGRATGIEHFSAFRPFLRSLIFPHDLASRSSSKGAMRLACRL